jgi:hypothetical protein
VQYTWLFGIIGGFAAYFAFVRQLLFITVRVNSLTARYMLRDLDSRNKFATTYTHKACETDQDFQDCFTRLPGTWGCWMKAEERILTAGHSGTDQVFKIVCFRWQLARVVDYLNALDQERLNGVKTPVEFINAHGWAESIGYLPDHVGEPLMEEEVYADFEQSVALCASGKMSKTGAILHGPPGNGKTSLARWLAKKYKMPVRIFQILPDMDNHKVTMAFARLPPKCMVLLEDFDSYFNGRLPVVPSGKDSPMKVTYDAILNVFDGVYSNFDGVVFVMTANDLSKIDPALKERPSRFRHIVEIGVPTERIRRKLLSGDSLLTAESEGWSLDQVLDLRDKQRKEWNRGGENGFCRHPILCKESIE